MALFLCTHNVSDRLSVCDWTKCFLGSGHAGGRLMKRLPWLSIEREWFYLRSHTCLGKNHKSQFFLVVYFHNLWFSNRFCRKIDHLVAEALVRVKNSINENSVFHFLNKSTISAHASMHNTHFIYNNYNNVTYTYYLYQFCNTVIWLFSWVYNCTW